MILEIVLILIVVWVVVGMVAGHKFYHWVNDYMMMSDLSDLSMREDFAMLPYATRYWMCLVWGALVGVVGLVMWYNANRKGSYEEK